MPNDWCDPKSWFYDSGNLKPAKSIPQNTSDIYVDNNLTLNIETTNCIDKMAFLQCDNLTILGSGDFIVGFLKAKNVSVTSCDIKNYTDDNNLTGSLYDIDNLNLTDTKVKNIAFNIAGKISGSSSILKNCIFLSDNIGLDLKQSTIKGFPTEDFPYSNDLIGNLKLSSGVLIESHIQYLKVENQNQIVIQNNSDIKECEIKGDVRFLTNSDHLRPSIIEGNCEFWDNCKNDGSIKGNAIFYGGGAENSGIIDKKANFYNGANNYGYVNEAEFYGNSANYGAVTKATFHDNSFNLGKVDYAIFKDSGCYNQGNVYNQAIFFSGSYNKGIVYNGIFNSGSYNDRKGKALGLSCSLIGARNEGTINVDNSVILNNSINEEAIISNSGNVILTSSSGIKESYIFGLESILLDNSKFIGTLFSSGLITLKNKSMLDNAVVKDAVFYDTSSSNDSIILNSGNFYNNSYLIAGDCKYCNFHNTSKNSGLVNSGIFNNNSCNFKTVSNALFYNDSTNSGYCSNGSFYDNSINKSFGSGNYLRFSDKSINAGSSPNTIFFSGNSVNIGEQIKNAIFFENSTNSGSIDQASLCDNAKNNGNISSGYLINKSINNGMIDLAYLSHESVNDKGSIISGYFSDSAKNSSMTSNARFSMSSINDTKGLVLDGLFYDQSINKGTVYNGNFYDLSTNNSTFGSNSITFYDNSSNIGNININSNLKFDETTSSIIAYSGNYPVLVIPYQEFLSDFFCNPNNPIEFKNYSTNKGNLKGYRNYIFNDNSKNFGQLSSYDFIPNHATVAYFSGNSVNCANMPKGKIIFSNDAINSGNISFGEFLNHSINYGNINSYSLPDIDIYSNSSFGTKCYTISNSDSLYFYNASINYGQISLSNGITLNGEDHKIKAVFDYAINAGNIAGSAIFNNSMNSGFVMKDGQFNDSINYGTVGGNGDFISGINYGTIRGSGSFLSSINYGNIIGSGSFLLNSINYGKVTNNSYLYNSKNISGIINGITYLYDNSINSGNLMNSGLFYGNSLNFGYIKEGAMFSNGSKNLAGVVNKLAIFNSLSYNSGLVVGAGYFDNSFNQGYVQGDATFINESYNGMDDVSLGNYRNINNQVTIDSIMKIDNSRNIGNGYVSNNVILESGTHNYGLIGGNVHNNMGYNCGYVLGTGSLVGINSSTDCILTQQSWAEQFYPPREITISRYFNINDDYYFFAGYWQWAAPNKIEADRRASIDINYFNSKLESLKSGIPIA